MRKNLVVLLLSFVGVFSLFAQTDKNGSYILKGQVIDSLTNETVPYATLRIVAADDPQNPRLLACDIDGKFETSLAKSGDYVVHMQSVGKSPAQKAFTITENRKTLDLGQIYMSEDQQRLEEVTVVAQKPIVKVDIDKITYNMEDDPEAQTNSTLDMLRKVPMVTVDGEDKIQLKGSSNFKIYLNGKPSNMLSSENASDVLKNMPASSIKNIEVITDPGAKYDAEGVGGIINITTSRNALQGYNATIRGNVSALGRFGGGGNFSTKVGKLGLTANYNYNNNRSPWTNSDAYRDNYNGERSFDLTTVGRNKYNNQFQWGSMELTYELDTLNLISIAGNIWRGNQKSRFDQSVIGDYYKLDSIYQYSQTGETRGNFGSIDANIDFQHSTSKKDELLTISYRFNHSPNDSKSFSDLIGIKNYDSYLQNNINNAHTNEQTVQIDYTTPLHKDQTIEAGVKYIMRQSKSDTERSILEDGADQWVNISGDDSDFTHTQHIYAAYLGYALKYKKMGFKAGARAEGTALRAKYKKNNEMDFSKDIFDIVPNATISYQLGMSQQLRLGYNMRIYRPGIWLLNPYVNDYNPQNVSYGNPYLTSEKSHGLNFNYSLFNMKFNFNASLNYRFVNNAIQRYSFVNPEQNGRTENTYDNIGKDQNVGLHIYTRWTPVPLFNITFNGGVSYTDIRVDDKTNNQYLDGLSNNGFQGNFYVSPQLNLPHNFRVDLFGGFYSGWIDLQRKSSNQSFHGISLNKGFLDKKLNISLSCQNPLQKEIKFTQTLDSDYFYERATSRYRARDIRLSVSYSFGNLKDSIKKVRRGITNDDTKSGGDGGGGGGQPQQ